MQELAASSAPQSPLIFIEHSSNGKRIQRKKWPAAINMFRGLLSESRSRIDRFQIAGLCGLMLLGVLFVYSATMINESALSAPLYKQKWVLQIAWYVLGLSAAAVVCLINYQTLARWGAVAYWCGVGLLALVLIFGTVRFGARRWFDLKFFLLQPSEFAKLAF